MTKSGQVVPVDKRYQPYEKPMSPKEVKTNRIAQERRFRAEQAQKQKKNMI